ncbi:MAG: cysteine methyltransferase [Candidatus Portnoybacteria bacterium CG_4_8_14_3_um_filter_40_10]|uniref:Cysteine methyltransferase n=4 Tax=Candidatus Portnoyibacteriota TaxID=1817913 RepID=A0A2M7IIG1_9BACT|nr:MAG: cysteine methyltransferase [Candidatus Portnoybacteria bacterium CG11_big_fil_rev_8_21_14_0_20_40_15]PIS31956.1 MAG: cysteine methyltransferase [Candidatus Portnoybacteria bacterium CG08_land_8_20_14_0_20_40_83]PIW76326.1 MAG: cysteine methyltransferase [Candidatus Portnoybacteria bacterium CG_4_8_14_3_um_filter_40_10]PIY74750.1 MAG: cysteine methyltransferase [Candidatus Portnoybacteria bacterium CG_4_10_14_0_8_um_filter_40_50]PJA64309.1 MAG: cysteine methyltransferase [Candidatus Port
MTEFENPVRKFKKKSYTNTSRISKFSNGVYEIVKKITGGKVLTYKQVAVKLGNTGLARAVGNALNKNRDENVPCHRVIRSDGNVGGYASGTEKKTAILKKEGLKIQNKKITK